MSKQWKRISYDVTLWRRMVDYSFVHRVLSSPSQTTRSTKDVVVKVYLWNSEVTEDTDKRGEIEGGYL